MILDDLLLGPIYFQALSLAVDSEIFERIERGENTYEKLCESLSIDKNQRSLNALLSLLEHLNLIFDKSGVFQNTKVTKRKLLKNSSDCELGFIKYADEVLIREIKRCGKEIIVEGRQIAEPQRPWEKSIEDLDRLFYKTENQADQLSDFLRQKAFVSGERLAARFPFENFKRIIDLGGNDGSFLVPIIKRFKNLEGAVFELPVMEDHLKNNLKKHGLEERISFEKGSIFHSELPKADCYLIRLVLHDFTDEACLKILQNIRKSLPDNAKLIIVENVVDNPSLIINKNILAMNIYLTFLGESYGNQSRERTTAEYIQLVKESGLKTKEVFYQNNLIMVCEKEVSSTSLVEPSSSRQEFRVCEAANLFLSKSIFVRLDQSGNLNTLVVKGLITEKEIVFGTPEKIHPIFSIGPVKHISIVDVGEYIHYDDSEEYTGRIVEVTYLKKFLPKLTYSRRVIWIKRINSVWGFYDASDRLIGII